MTPNPLKSKLAAGGLVIGHCVMEFNLPSIAPVLAGAGLDFVLFDFEHTALSLETLAPMLAACGASQLPAVVRVPGLSGHFISRCLDIGATGIMAPNIRSADEARAFAAAAKYPPEGRRGMGLGGAHTGYQPVDPVAYGRWANDEIVLIPQIESVEAVEAIDEILSVPGVDVGWVGAMDLSLSLGVLGQYDHERFLGALAAVAAACKRHGKGAGIQPGSTALALRWRDLGYNVISMATDIAVYQRAVRDAVQGLRPG